MPKSVWLCCTYYVKIGALDTEEVVVKVVDSKQKATDFIKLAVDEGSFFYGIREVLVE